MSSEKYIICNFLFQEFFLKVVLIGILNQMWSIMEFSREAYHNCTTWICVNIQVFNDKNRMHIIETENKSSSLLETSSFRILQEMKLMIHGIQ